MTRCTILILSIYGYRGYGRYPLFVRARHVQRCVKKCPHFECVIHRFVLSLNAGTDTLYTHVYSVSSLWMPEQVGVCEWWYGDRRLNCLIENWTLISKVLLIWNQLLHWYDSMIVKKHNTISKTLQQIHCHKVVKRAKLFAGEESVIKIMVWSSNINTLS